MIIELLKCQGCWRIVDQFTMGLGCDSCLCRFFKQIRPSKINAVKWFLSNPKHVIKLIIQDFWERV